MKNIFSLGLIVSFGLVGCVSVEQQNAYHNPMKNYSEIVTLQGKSKDEIFNESKQWIARNFKSSNNVVQYADANSGTIIGKGNFQFPCSGFIECSAYQNSNINFTLTIDSKDEKARLSFDDLGIYMPPSTSGGYKFAGGDNLPIWQDKQKAAVKSRLEQIVKTYKSDLEKGSSKSNW